VGGSEESLLGGRLFDTIHPQDAPLVREAWTEARHSGKPFEAQARVRDASKGYRWFLIRAFPQRSDDAEIACWYGLHIDIEERRREQESLTRRQESLSRLSRTLSMSEVAASIAHELNQPMTAVVTHADACLEWAKSQPPNLEKVTATAEKIVRESTRAAAVVRRVRSLFSDDEPVRAEADMNQLIEDSAHLLRDDAIREGVKIDLQLSPELPRVMIDPVQVQQVIINLSKNAIEAMSQAPKDRILSIATEAVADLQKEILITIRDTGPGIQPEIMEYIFEPFFSTKKHGTGIGLAICRSIVEAHNGHISVSNGAAAGAIVQIGIPVTA